MRREIGYDLSIMLEKTFIHLPGIGARTEARLWERGIRTWDDFLNLEKPPFNINNFRAAKELLAGQKHSLEAGNGIAQKVKLPPSETWRVFPSFKGKVAFLDIETTGISRDSHITTICMYDGTELKSYVWGDNLNDFEADIHEYPVIATFNGRCFDVPVIERHFSTKLDQAHIDLRCVFTGLGIKGGLKAIEKKFGLERDGLDGVNGYFAVLLWNEYDRYKNDHALETLLAYNAMDAVNLEPLMVKACNMCLEKTPFDIGPFEPGPGAEIPFTPHQPTIDKLMGTDLSRLL